MNALAGILGAALLVLAGCGPAPYLSISDHARTWQPETSGTLLRFAQPGTGAVDTLRVEVTEFDLPYEEAILLSHKQGSQQQLVLNYLRTASRAPDGLVVSFSNARIEFDMRPKPRQDGAFHLFPAPIKEENYLYPDLYAPVLLDTVVLAGRGYGRTLYSCPPPIVLPGRIQEFWYARRAGLVAYTTADGKVWYRQ